MTEEQRGYVYRLLSAVGLVLVFYGLISQEELALWLGVAANIILTVGNLLATFNTQGIFGRKPPEVKAE